MSGEVFKSEAEYEAMPIEELSAIKDYDLKLILQRVFGLDSVVYFIDKVQKLRYISQPDQRPIVLEEGETKRARHRETNKENRVRPSGDVADRMEEETKGRKYRVKATQRHEDRVEDDFTGRSIKVAHVIEDVVDGSEFTVSRGTARWLVEKDRLEGFDVTKGRKSAAHAAGMKSAADLLGDATPVVAVKPKQQETVTIPDDEEIMAEVQEEEVGSGNVIADDELDEILNSLPS